MTLGINSKGYNSQISGKEAEGVKKREDSDHSFPQDCFMLIFILKE